MILKLAWRNIWRNKRRTLITTASVFLAIFLALFMRSMQIGTYARMIDNVLRAYTGYIQIHKKGYWEEKDINNSFELNDSLQSRLSEISNIIGIIPRLESFALASNDQKTKGAVIIGIEPKTEDKMTRLSELVIKGRYIHPNDSGIMVSKRMAEYLDIKVNDTLVLIGQGYHGVSAAGKFPVKGIVHLRSPDLDNQFIYMSLSMAQEFYSAESRITSLAINLENPDKIDKTAKRIKTFIDHDKFEVMKWEEMLVELVQYIATDNASGLIMMGILYVIIGFGIFGTILMMTMERIREFGVMISVGMQKIRVGSMIALESVFIGMLGVATGVVVTLPLLFYYVQHPVPLTGALGESTENYGFEALLCFEPPGIYFLNNALLVLLIVFISMIYPLQKIARMKIINALRHKV